MSADTNPNYYFQPENEECKLWRYMSFSKFVSMVSSGCLHFSRSDMFIDKFEGTFPTKNIEQRKNIYDKKLERNLTIFTPILKKFTFINCWHINEYESAAMWELYGGNEGAIAIETNYLALKKYLPFDVGMSCIKYINYQEEIIRENNIQDPYIHKRKSFEHEKELRLILQNENEINLYLLASLKHKIDNPYQNLNTESWLDENIPKIKKIDVNLNEMINTIHISPFAPKWIFELVKEISIKYNIFSDIKQSNLYDDPIY